MKLDKAKRRDKKRKKQRYGMKGAGKWFIHIQNAILKRRNER